MPWKAPRPCSFPRCPEMAARGHSLCRGHLTAMRRREERGRKSAAARGYGHRWRKYRIVYLKKHPLCVRCLAEGRYVASSVVDHIVPHRGDKRLFWDPANHQALCARCHNIKTAAEDGGFGNPVGAP